MRRKEGNLGSGGRRDNSHRGRLRAGGGGGGQNSPTGDACGECPPPTTPPRLHRPTPVLDREAPGQQVTTWRKYRLSKGAMSRPPNPGAQGLGLLQASLSAPEPSPAACSLQTPPLPRSRSAQPPACPPDFSLQPPAPDFNRHHHPPTLPEDRLPRAQVPGLPGRG